MSIILLNLDTLLNSDREDSISGRTFGQGYAERERILPRLKNGDTFKVIISPKIKFVNDSFWKGFFNNVFREYKTKNHVLEKFSFEASQQITENIMENLDVLHAIYNH